MSEFLGTIKELANCRLRLYSFIVLVDVINQKVR